MAVHDARLGIEDLQLAVLTILVNQLNGVIDDENARGATTDAAYQSLTGWGLGTVVAEHVAIDNFHPGHRPSMIDAPIDQYPSVAVMAYTTQQSPTNIGMDHQRDVSILLSIECLVKSDPEELDDYNVSDGEEIVERRIKRTAEAIHTVMAANRPLTGYVYDPNLEPTVTFGEVFARNDRNDGANYRFYWQGVRFQFTFIKTNKLYGVSIDQA